MEPRTVVHDDFLASGVHDGFGDFLKYSKNANTLAVKDTNTLTVPNFQILVNSNHSHRHTSPLIPLYIQNIQFIFLLDTGVTSCIIKDKKLCALKNLNINRNETYSVSGIAANALLTTIGSVSPDCFLNEYPLNVKFQIIHQNSDISEDGIFGMPFFDHEKAILDLANKTIKLKSLQLHNIIKIPPRAESVIEITMHSPEIVQKHNWLRVTQF